MIPHVRHSNFRIIVTLSVNYILYVCVQVVTNCRTTAWTNRQRNQELLELSPLQEAAANERNPTEIG